MSVMIAIDKCKVVAKGYALLCWALLRSLAKLAYILDIPFNVGKLELLRYVEILPWSYFDSIS